jgi:hypothetical protein
MKEDSLVVNLNICYMTFCDSLKIDELIEEQGHKVSGIPLNHCSFSRI